MRLVPKKKEILILPFLIRFAYNGVGRPDFLCPFVSFAVYFSPQIVSDLFYQGFCDFATPLHKSKMTGLGNRPF